MELICQATSTWQGGSVQRRGRPSWLLAKKHAGGTMCSVFLFGDVCKKTCFCCLVFLSSQKNGWPKPPVNFFFVQVKWTYIQLKDFGEAVFQVTPLFFALHHKKKQSHIHLCQICVVQKNCAPCWNFKFPHCPSFMCRGVPSKKKTTPGTWNETIHQLYLLKNLPSRDSFRSLHHSPGDVGFMSASVRQV